MENQISLGESLTKARSEQSLDHKELSQKTKISIKILTSLEGNNLENLPKKIYVKGFIKILAKTLKLDEQELLAKLDSLYNEQSTQAEEPITIQEPEITQPQSESKSNILEQIETQDKIDALKKVLFDKKTIIALISLLMIIVVVNLLSSFITSLKNEQVSIKKNFTSEPAVSETIQAKDDATIKANDQSLFKSEALTKMKDQESLKSLEKDNTKEIIAEKTVEEVKEPTKKKKEEAISNDKKFPYKRFYPAPINVFNIVKDSNEAQDLKLLPSSFKNQVKEGLENILIYTLEDTWISYSIDQKEIKRYVLSANKHLFLQGEEVLLFLGNFNSTKIFYNNKLISADTTTGVKSLIFPEARSKELKLPLFPSYKGIPYSQQYYVENMSPAN